MPLLCNYFGLDTPCRIALQGNHYFPESNLIKGLDEVAPDLTPSLLLEAIIRKDVECIMFESILEPFNRDYLCLVLLDFLFSIQKHILEASAKKLVVVHLLKPLILRFFLDILTSANSQPIKASAKEELSCTLAVEKLGHVVLSGHRQILLPDGKAIGQHALAHRHHPPDEFSAIDTVLVVLCHDR